MTTKELLDSDPSFAEDPLQFLTGKKRSDMTEAEIRQFTDTIRQRREVSQTFRASLAMDGEGKPARVQKPLEIDDYA